MSASAKAVVGALVAGDRLFEYEILGVLGQGGFGITYLARDTHLEKTVAIKEFLPAELAVRVAGGSISVRSDDERQAFDWGRENFLKEARVLARFDHPNLIRVHRFFEAHGSAYFVMAYAEGEPLDALLKRERTLPEPRLRELLLPLLEGLEDVHRAGVLHRDIKPGNIILCSDGTPVLIDFGAARQELSSKTRSVMSALTGGYAPIEQYAIAGHQGPWTDLYALGAVAYRVVSGKRPIDSVSRAREDPLVPAAMIGNGRYAPALLAAIDWAMEVDAEDRPRSIADWRLALEGAMPVPVPRRGDVATRNFEPSTGTEVLRHEPAPATPEATEATEVMARAALTPAVAAAAPQTPLAAVAVRAEEPALRRAPRSRRETWVIAILATLLVAMTLLAWFLRREPPVVATAAPGEAPAEIAPTGTVPPVAVAAPASEVLPPAAKAEPALPAPETAPAPVLMPDPAPAKDPVVVAPATVPVPVPVPATTTTTPGTALAPAPGPALAPPQKPAPKPTKKPATKLPAAVKPPVAAGAPAIAVAQMTPLQSFADCDNCPMMVVLPAGRFRMGAAPGEGVNAWEQPLHEVRLRKPIAIARFETTGAQWRACVESGGCPGPAQSGNGAFPVVERSWTDAKAFAAWLSQNTRRRYRLPSEAEWEYAIRAGTSSSRFWGEARENQCAFANAADAAARRVLDSREPRAQCNDGFGTRAPVGEFNANNWGLHDLAGNVWEWTLDCWRDGYAGAPANGQAVDPPGCKRRVIRGGSWRTKPESLRSAARGLSDIGLRSDDLGFRVVAE